MGISCLTFLDTGVSGHALIFLSTIAEKRCTGLLTDIEFQSCRILVTGTNQIDLTRGGATQQEAEVLLKSKAWYDVILIIAL